MTVKQEWLDCAVEALAHAYVPYSNFPVGACLVTADGKMYQGVNIENASFGLTNCAERTAIFTGVASGETKIKVIAIAGSAEEYTYPCGICRQVLCEFADGDAAVILVKNEDDYIVKTMEEVMPGAFRKENIR